MGLNGLLVFRYKGKCYSIYNRYGSVPSEMGVDLLKQLYNLLRKFRGDVKSACQYWGEMLVTMPCLVQTVDIQSYTLHALRRDHHAFSNIEIKLKKNDMTSVIFYKKVASTIDDFTQRKQYKYNWEIDLDVGQLSLFDNSTKRESEIENSRKCVQSTSMKTIHLTFNDISRRPLYCQSWVRDYEGKKYSQKTGKLRTGFMKHYHAILIQRQFRCYSAWHASYIPGGLHYMHAAKRFKIAVGKEWNAQVEAIRNFTIRLRKRKYSYLN
jgi:hypothetical protein